VKETVNRSVFRRDLKFSRDNVFLISAGSLFHKVGAATLNAQSPDDPSFRDDFLMDTSSHRYVGAISVIDL
jgi:hypothetical protein